LIRNLSIVQNVAVKMYLLCPDLEDRIRMHGVVFEQKAEVC